MPLYLQSTPDRGEDFLADLHSADGVRGALQHQNTLRPYGFNFSSDLQPMAYDGGLLLGNRRRGLAVAPDRAVTAAAAATPDMLAWATGTLSMGGRISVFVLTELTSHTSTLSTGTSCLMSRADGPIGSSPRGSRSPLPGPSPPAAIPTPPMYRGEAQPAMRDDWNRSWSGTGDPERDAHEALARLYALFGIDLSANPYVTGQRIDTAQLHGRVVAGA